MTEAVVTGLLIGVGGIIFSVLVPLPICGVRFVNSIYSLLVYLIVVVSIFGVLILAKFSGMERARREPGAEHGEAKDKASEP